MDEKELMIVEEGLNELLIKYKKNQNEGDLWRAEAVRRAKLAIRGVMLAMAIKGDIKDIVPIIEREASVGWEVKNNNNEITRYVA